MAMKHGGFARIVFSACLVTVFLSSGLASIPAALAESSAKAPVRAFSSDGRLLPGDAVRASISGKNLHLALDSAELPVARVQIERSSLQSFAPSPAVEGYQFSYVNEAGKTYIEIRTEVPVESMRIKLRSFDPNSEVGAFTAGDDNSLRLERPMIVRRIHVDHGSSPIQPKQNSNGTHSARHHEIQVDKIGFEFDGNDHSGQTLFFNRAWLMTQEITNPRFEYADGTHIPSDPEELGFKVHAPHFSIIYTFEDSPDGFSQLSSFPGSTVMWSSPSKALWWESDRTDTGDEILTKTYTGVSSVSSSWFRLSAKVKITGTGHYVGSYPLWLGSGFPAGFNIGNTDPFISFYWMYFGDDLNNQKSRMYMQYRDDAGTYRINKFRVLPNLADWYTLEIEFAKPWLKMRVKTPTGSTIGATEAYQTGTQVNDGFPALSNVAVASDGRSQPWEPRATGFTDDIRFEGNLAGNILNNPSFEIDSTGDWVPDNWRQITYSGGLMYRSTSVFRSGSASIRMSDPYSTAEQGIATEYVPIQAGKYYSASAWILIDSASPGFDMNLEFFDSSLTRVGYYKLSSTAAGAQLGVWSEIRVTTMAPENSVFADVLLFSQNANIGNAYWDDVELRMETKSFWSVNFHESGDIAKVRKIFDHARNLGARHVRIDIPWFAMEPTNCQPDPWCWPVAIQNQWNLVLDEASMRGLDVIFVLGHFPSWAQPNDYAPSEISRQAWEDYCFGIATLFGSKVHYYQILNEENHPRHSQVSGYHEGQYIHRCWEGLSAGDTYDTGGFETILNVWVGLATDVGFLRVWMNDLVSYAGSTNAIDVLAIDHYPGSWVWEQDYNHWDELTDTNPSTDDLAKIMLDFTKLGAIMETGFPSTTECPDAAAFVSSALPEIRSKVAAHNLVSPTNRKILMANFYELVDADTGLGPSCWGWSLGFEDNFGIIRSTWNGVDYPTKEASFNALLIQFAFPEPL